MTDDALERPVWSLLIGLFFNSLPPVLTDGVSFVPRRPLIDRAAARPLDVLRYVSWSLAYSGTPPQNPSVVCLVGTHCHSTATRNLFRDHQCGIPPSAAVRLENLRGDYQIIAILDQQVAVITQFGFLAIALARQQCIGDPLSIDRTRIGMSLDSWSPCPESQVVTGGQIIGEPPVDSKVLNWISR